MKGKLGFHATSWVMYTEHLFEEAATTISLEDDCGGFYIKLSQCRDDTEKGVVTFNDDELEVLFEVLTLAKKTIEENQNG